MEATLINALLGAVVTLVLLINTVMLHDIRKLRDSHDDHRNDSIETVHKPIQDLKTWRDGANERIGRIERKVGINGE